MSKNLKNVIIIGIVVLHACRVFHVTVCVQTSRLADEATSRTVATGDIYPPIVSSFFRRICIRDSMACQSDFSFIAAFDTFKAIRR